MSVTFPANLGCKITTNSKKSTKVNLIRATFGNGYKQIANNGLNNEIDTWELQFALLEGTNFTDMNTFIAAAGADQLFAWTPFGETVSKNWRIVKDSVKITYVSTTSMFVNMSIEQAF